MAKTEPRSAKVQMAIIPDDGGDGVFWRGGVRWLREAGKETPLATLAPCLESQAMMELLPVESLAQELTEAKDGKD